MGIRGIYKVVLGWVTLPLWRRWTRKPRRSRYRGVTVVVPPGVFHPGLFLSTRFLIDHLAGHALAGRSLLEIGAGSGMIAISAAKRGAIVTATDISGLAIAAIRANAAANGVEMNVVQSDLFVDLEVYAYDFLVINPPYYPRNPTNEEEYAWFCGEEFEYFQRLFAGLGQYSGNGGKVLMVLSQDCKLDEIMAIAAKAGWAMEVVDSRRRLAEWNYVFQITPLSK